MGHRRLFNDVPLRLTALGGFKNKSGMGEALCRILSRDRRNSRPQQRSCWGARGREANFFKRPNQSRGGIRAKGIGKDFFDQESRNKTPTNNPFRFKTGETFL